MQKKSKFRNGKLTITCITSNMSKIKYIALFEVVEVKIAVFEVLCIHFHERSLYDFDGEAVNSLKICIFSCV